MLKNFHWGHGITVFFILFVSTLVFVLIKSFGVDRTLVVDDYYAKDLAYQSQYEKMEGQLAADNLSITQDGQSVQFQFKNEAKPSGEIFFYRASDKSLDFAIGITDNLMTIPTAKVKSGKWTVKIDWQQAGKKYYKEETLFL